MKKGVAIIGVGQTEYKIHSDKSIPEMVYTAVKAALEDAGISIKDIDNVVSSSCDLWDGRTASGVAITEVVGAVMKTETRVSNDGMFAAAHAYMGILSGCYNISLVVAHCKLSEASHFEVSNWVFDPIYQQMLGIDYLSAAALQARWYMSKYGITERDCAEVVVKNRKNGMKNKFVTAEQVTVDDVLNSEVVASPIKSLDIPPLVDGACALVLASDKIKNGVRITGFGYYQDAHYLGDRDLSESRALSMASERAFEQAGIKNPAKEIDVAEISEEFSYQEMLWCECIGFCERGKGNSFVNNTDVLINPSGGILSGNPPFVAGLARLAEAYLQINAKKTGKALAHGVCGPAGQSHCVMILEK